MLNLSGWTLLWKVVLVGGLGAFAVVSVWVILAGWGDIRALYQKLAAAKKNGHKEQPATLAAPPSKPAN